MVEPRAKEAKGFVFDLEEPGRATGDSMKVNDMDSDSVASAEELGTDRGAEGRGPSPTLRKAEVGLLLASGEEKQLGPAMRRVGLARSTSEAPKRNGYTVAGTLEAMREAFPGVATLETNAILGMQRTQEFLSDPEQSRAQQAVLGVQLEAKRHELGLGGTETGIDTLGPYRNAEAAKLLDRLVHVARLTARLGLDRVVAALVARRDEIELGPIEEHEREAVPVLRRSVAAALGETLSTPAERSSSNMARVYRRRRAGGFTVAETPRPELRRDRR